MPQDRNPIETSPAGVDQPTPNTPPRKRKKCQGRGLQKFELKLTSMIDVVFLLLIFFVVTASFQIEEASLQARLPGNSTTEHEHLPPPTPVLVDLRSSDDGVTYSLRVNGLAVDGVSELSDYMAGRVQAGQMASDDLVKIKPQGVVRWQHVLNVYNACVNAELERVTFAQ
ncbi:MAG: biopolymer transporter ExbD [Planctomycetota bacterium]